MKILVTGGCGNMGPHIVKNLLARGHAVRVIDIDQSGLSKLPKEVETVCGNLSQKDVVRQAVNGVDAIIHLAWSFSDNLNDLLDIDVKGYQYLLDAAVEYNVKNVVNTTTAVSYGKPLSLPVQESQEHQISLSRNPVYGLAKFATEELTRIYAVQHQLNANSLMVWYAYGDVIGGRNIRAMIRDAITKGSITVPDACGGSFIQLDDYVELAMLLIQGQVKGELFNAASIYLTWADIARIITKTFNPDAVVNAIHPKDWTGSAFLIDDWPLSMEKAEKMLGFKSVLTKEAAIESLVGALKVSAERVYAEINASK